MPFKNITAPRKVHSLDADIRGVAVLSSPALVAMVSTDPVRLGVCPVGGSAGKTTNVSLSSAEDVALLSKDFALVRSEDAVWALLDITHTPKMDQVGRDARLLAPRPTGETALTLRWDGGATELKVNGHEVEERPFVLRGTVRGFDLTEGETYAFVDSGGEGGELRVHPGATPEPGASHRASLPREAAKLDRIRGGQKLTAIYKRGSSAVCAVVKSGSRLDAKMIALDSPAADVAVLESSLFVAFADGRAALYDGAAIAGAGGAPLAPTATLQLGARGEPRVIAIAGKASPALWIGTSAGEMISAAIIRKTPA
jgi:hypothetical protein